MSLTETSAMCITDMRSYKCASALSFTNSTKIPKGYATVAEHTGGKNQDIFKLPPALMSPILALFCD